MDKFINILTLCFTALGTIFCGIAAYFGAAGYYGWSPSEAISGSGDTAMKPPTWVILLFILGIIMLLSTWIIIYKINTTSKSNEKVSHEMSQQNWDKIQKTTVIGKTFIAQRVLLDGHSYSHCKFIGVTFVYNGTAPFDLSYNEIHSPIIMSSDKVNIELLLSTMYELKFFREDFKIYKEYNKSPR